ncbi:uncharacterized protein Tco025E_04458 [Trypanosoma conorhini]|uniref:Uncharacterized protein n=1 Tax=Trypanosoma conorhini TaxID=83891 RepID=A0A422PL74_9TRYP|nr:uncharacterized protein Tco025E_04458 [Trypanosoma conorhini]RNF18438.1 hypothetical protein Tco025E_04458 [Trypanosoma conorhini]
MANSVEAVEVDEVRRVLLSLGYHNPSADDIALTLQQVRDARRSESEQQQQLQLQRQSFSPVGRNEGFRPSSTSPPRAANDVTMAPHANELIEVDSDEGNPRRTSTSQKQWPGLSSHSVREGRTTPMNSTGTGRHPRRGRVAAAQPSRGKCYPPSCLSGGSVVVEGHTQSMRRDRRGRRGVDPKESLTLGCNNTVSARASIMIPTGGGTARGIGDGAPHPLDSVHVNPQARLGRHMRRYEKGLKTLYSNTYGDEGPYEPRDAEELYDEDEEEYEDDYTEFGSHEEGARNLAMFYGARPHHPPATPQMPLRPSRVLLSQRSANTIYSFTGDIRYKYRGGLGAPLCAVLGPDGSTLRHRSDPVRRGQQMRDMWKRDKFLAQQSRKEDRWRIRQSMLAWEPL